MDEDRLRRKQEELRKRREHTGGGDFWNPKPGPNRIRILPNWTKDFTADFFYESLYHKNLGADKKKSCVCPKGEGLDYCPICDEAKRLFSNKNAEDTAFAKEIYKKTRVYWNIVDMDAYFEIAKWNKEHPAEKDQKPQKGVQVMTTGSGVLDDVIAYCLNPQYGDVTDPEKGRNITLVMTEKEKSRSGWNEYMVQPDPDRTMIEDPDWLDHMVDLRKFIKILPAEEMIALLAGVEEDAPQDEAGKPEKPVDQPKAEPDQGKPAKAFKPCRGKFDSMDTECLICPEKDECIEVRKTKTAPKPAEEPAKVETPKEDPKPAPAPETNIQDKLAKIREKMKK